MVRQGNPGTNGPRRNPRKPSSRVFRRRRLFAAVALLLVIGIGIGGFVAVSNAINAQLSPGGGAAADADQPGASPDAASAPAASAGASAAPAEGGCEQNLVTVRAATDKAAYPAGENPMLSLKVTNGNKVPCQVNMGTSQMEFLIISGSDRIFSSQDCQADSTDLVKTIGPGQTEAANFPWQRNRTVEGCAPVDASPGANGAYYVFTARLANKTSSKAVFQLK